MIRRGLFAALASFALLFPLAAGDIATFSNLGFSVDSSYFMFGQYGIEASTSRPWAELSFVDTKKNDFVPKGLLKKIYPAKIEAGQSPEAALFALFAESLQLAKTLRIDHFASGRLIYALTDDQEVPQKLEFRDFKTEDAWEIALNKTQLEGRDSVRSSFGLAITRTSKDGSVRRATAGNPNLVREGVKDYRVSRVIVAPDEKTIVLIIEKLTVDKGDPSIRFMVETLKLP